MKSETTLSLPVRRASIVVMFCAFIAGALLFSNSDAVGPVLGLGGSIALFAASFAAFVVLFLRTRYWRWGNDPDERLDEFHLAARNRAYLNAYRGLASLVLMAMLVARIGGDLNLLGALTGVQTDVAFWGAFVLILILPPTILAWTDQSPAD